MAGVGLGQGLGAGRRVVAREDFGADRRIKGLGVQAKLTGERVIQFDEPRSGRRGGRGGCIEAGEFAGVSVIKRKAKFTRQIKHYS